MAIGTSSGNYFDDTFAMVVANKEDTGVTQSPNFRVGHAFNTIKQGQDEGTVTKAEPLPQITVKQDSDVLPKTAMLNEGRQPSEDPHDYTQMFNTPLNEEMSRNYSTWMDSQSKRLGRDLHQDTYDYDMQGYFKNTRPPIGGTMDIDPNTHFPDTFKKPNHPSFSNESQYHGSLKGDLGPSKYEGGEWQKDGDKWLFTPGKTNLDIHGPQKLRDYFNRVEPGNQLLLPGSENDSIPANAQLTEGQMQEHKSFYDSFIEKLQTLRDAVGANSDPRKDIGLAMSALPMGRYAGPTIKAAAIRMPGGKILEGPTHYNIMEKTGLPDEAFNNARDGFITSDGNFVTRKQAEEIFKKYTTRYNTKDNPSYFKSEGYDNVGLASEDLRNPKNK